MIFLWEESSTVSYTGWISDVKQVDVVMGVARNGDLQNNQMHLEGVNSIGEPYY